MKSGAIFWYNWNSLKRFGGEGLRLVAVPGGVGGMGRLYHGARFKIGAEVKR
jgi:hypothetical protein